MQVGSLFNLKAFGTDEEPDETKRAQLRKDRAFKKEIQRQRRKQQFLQTHGHEMSSESSSEDSDPETARE